MRITRRIIRRSPFLLLAFLTALLCAVAVPTLADIPADVPNLSAQPVANSTDPQSLEQQAKYLFDAGQYREAIPLLRQAAQFYQTQNDRLRQSIALSNLALTYQQQGNWDVANQTIATSLTILRSPDLSETTDRLSALAQVLDIQGRLQLTQGQPDAALTSWQQAAQFYTQLNATDRLVRNQIDQSRALQALGLYQRADELLETLTETLQSQPASLAKAAGLRSLGDTLRATGDFSQSREKLQQSLTIAQQLQTSGNSSPELEETIALIHLSLGNTARAQQATSAALSFYQQAASGSVSTRLQAQLNQLSVLVKMEQWSNAEELLPEVQSQISQLPLSQSSIYAQINFAQSLLQGKEYWQGKNSESTITEVAQVLSTAAQQAESLEDARAQAYALGKLGELYEETQQWTFAEDLTRRALQLAKATANASDITYLWQWQLGRILKAQAVAGITPEQNKAAAITAYEAALETLQTLRLDLVSANPDEQFSFREAVEPVYRELIELLLESAPDDLAQQLATTDEVLQQNLVKARVTLESLQVAELQDFFRQACTDLEVSIDQVVDQLNQQTQNELAQSNSRVAILYPIIQPHKLSVILKLPQQKFLHYSTEINQTVVKDQLRTFRSQLTQPSMLVPLKKTSEEVYDWLIRPAEAVLQDDQIKTLVFVLDGYLKNIPMSALYDGSQYLMERYNVAITPGLEIPDPIPLDRTRIRLLFAGQSEAVPSEVEFPPLPFVENEGEQIKEIVPNAIVLLNQKFTDATLQSEIEATPFQIVHLATHGQFSSNQDETFILTSQGRVKVTEFDRILRSREQTRPEPIELLVLSACETAEGDERAALGLAGVAVRAGARSTIASLWSVYDQTAAFLIPEFYRQLVNTDNLSKTEALRQAQLTVLQTPGYEHPVHWAPYILVGNWL